MRSITVHYTPAPAVVRRGRIPDGWTGRGEKYSDPEISVRAHSGDGPQFRLVGDYYEEDGTLAFRDGAQFAVYSLIVGWYDFRPGTEFVSPRHGILTVTEAGLVNGKGKPVKRSW